MNKQLATKAANITKRIAKKYGADPMVTLNESPMDSKRTALYLDGDIVSLYWNHDGFGWDFQTELQDEFSKAGIFAEPYTSTIFDVYKEQ